MEQLKLENQLCFPIYALSRQITSMYRPHLEKLKLTYPQYLVMMVLWEHQKVSVKRLGELLYLDSGTLTPLLKRMAERGWLSRERRAADERVVDIILSAKGRDLQVQATNIPDALSEQMETSEEEFLDLRKQIRKILKSVETKA